MVLLFERWSWWLIVGLALALRLVGLDRKSVWFDEALGVEAASLPLGGLLTTVGAERNPPLYFLVQHFWLPLHAGDWWLRFPAAVAGALAVGVAMVFARDLLGRTAGTFVGVLLAVSPMAVDLSQEARPYGLMFLCASASLVCLERALTAGRARPWWLGYVASTVAALYTHNFAVFLIAAEALFVGWWMVRRRYVDWSAILAMGVSAALFVPWVAHLMGQVQLVSGGFWIERPSAGVFWDIYQGLLVYAPLDHASGTNPVLRVERWLVLGLLGLGLFVAVRSRLLPLAVLVVVVPVLLALSVSLVAVPIFVLRYVAFALGAFWTVAAGGLSVLPGRRTRVVVGAFVLLGVAMNLVALYRDPYYGRSDLRAAAAFIESQWQPGDLIVHTSEFSAVPFDYYLRGRLEQVLVGAEDDVALRAAAAEHGRVWLVRDFGLMDPAEAEQAASALPGLPVGRRFDWLGVYVFLSGGDG